VAASPESVEKIDTMKKRYNSLQEMNPDYDGAVSESEYETDGEEVKRVMTGRKKGSKNKKRKVTVTLEN
jgi:protein MAK11